MSPNTRIVQSDTVRRLQAQRDLEALPWAPRVNGFSVWLSKAVLYFLLPVCVAVYVMERWA